MVISKKDKRLMKKAMENDYGLPRLCSICRKKITEEDVQHDNFEYVKNKLRRKLCT